jgi:HEAT repeat protein
VSPFLNAVAQFVIDLSIAVKQHLIYGADHPVARANRRKLDAKLAEAFRFNRRLQLYFAGGTILCEGHYLDRKNPIYRQFAGMISGVGIAGLAFCEEISEGELDRLIDAISGVRSEHLAPAAARARLEAARGEHLDIDFLRDMISYREAATVTAPAGADALALWQGFLRDLSEAQESVATEAGEAAAAAAPPASADDEAYARAMIDYLRLLDRAQREKLLLRGNLVGAKVQELVAALHPELRDQLVSSVVASRELSPWAVGNFLQMVGHEQLVGVLQRVNAEGRSLPPSLSRALSLLSLDPAPERGGQAVPSAPAPTSAPALAPPSAAAFELLAGEDRPREYIGPEYALKLAALEDFSHRAAVRPHDADPAGPSLDPREAEEHFLETAADLLALFPEDAEMAAGTVHHSGQSFLWFLERGGTRHCLQAIALGRRARALAGEPSPTPAWEKQEVIAGIAGRLAAKETDAADQTVIVLCEIGAPAVAPLLRVFDSPDLTVRHRAFDALVGMKEDPAPALLACLTGDQPWFVQRNVIAVLRERHNPAGLATAKELWASAQPRVRVEVLQYLHDFGDAQTLELYRQALAARSAETVLGAARLLLRWRDPGAARLLIERLERLAIWQQGSTFHLELLRVLARSGDPAARDYVAAVPAGQRALPWRAARLRQEVASMLGPGGAP